MTNAPSGTDAARAPVAPISRRVIAYVIDAAIASVIGIAGSVVSFVVTGATGGQGLSAALAGLATGLGITAAVLLAWFLVYTFLQGSSGSLGMRVMRLRLVRDGSGAPLGFGRALLRNVVFGLSTAIVVGYFTPLFDGSGRFQGWHDRAAGALMRDVRRAGAAHAPSSGAAAVSVPGTMAAPAPAGSPAAPSAPGAAAFAPPQAADWSRPAEAPPAQGMAGVPVSGPAAGVPGSPTAEPAAAAFAGTPAAGSAPGPLPVPDPHEATVLSPAAQAAANAAHDGAMITVVPGVSPSVPAPAPVAVSGPEMVAPARPPAPAAPPATVAEAIALAPVVQPAEEEDPEETRISIPGHRLQFVWDDGARATVSGRTLFGRNPAPEAGALVVVVRDETLSLSKTHFEAAAEASGGWVMDRHSTNGMTIVRDGVRIACPPGERVRIRLGDAIEIGDRIVTVGGYA